MNSHDLQKKHSEAYSTFFSKADRVLSLPFILKFVGNERSESEALSITWKIPIRMYIGIEEMSQSGYTLWELSYYDTHEHGFITTTIERYLPYIQTLKEKLEKYSNNQKWTNRTGYRFSFLSEVSRGTLYGFESNMAALIALSIAYINSQENIDHIMNIATHNYNEHIHTQDSPIHSIFQMASDLEKALIWNIFSQNMWMWSIFTGRYLKVSVHNSHKWELPYLFSIIPGSEDVWNSSSLPLDISIVYSGKPAMLDQIEHAFEHAESWEQKATKQAKELFQDVFDDIPAFHRPSIYRDFLQKDDQHTMRKSYNQLSQSISIEIFYTLQKLHIWRYTENAIKYCIEALDKVLYKSLITEPSSSSFQEFIKNLRYHLHAKEWVYAVVPLNTSIMGGSVAVYTPIEWFRGQFAKSFQETVKKFSDAQILYSNWIDGIEIEWLKIEQDIIRWMYSSFLQYNTVVLDIGSRGKKLWKYEYLVLSEEDIILDTIKKRIWIWGMKLTSTEIHSQSTAIDILSYLIAHPNENIDAQTFGISSYTLSRHEMTGKIIHPLIRQVLIKTGKKLNIETTSTDRWFTIFYTPWDIKIGRIIWLRMNPISQKH